MDTFTLLRSLRWRSLAGIAVTALTLAGCGGSSGGGSTMTGSTDSSCSGSSCGTLMVGVTDAEGDFLNYSVDVQSVTLQRQNGATVELLPATTRIDFAQLTDLSDLLAASTLAGGDFLGGTIRVDYSTAEVFVEVAGQSVKANVVDSNGQALGVTELTVQLSNRNHLVVTPARVSFLTLDFDLAASNSVDTTQNPPVVTARPYIVADVEPAAQRDLRVRGALISADTTASTYTVQVRPWFVKDGDHGKATVHTTSTTSFEINGVASMGSDGLTALAALPAGTLTVAFGTLSTADKTFTATTVQAGDSVGGERLDAVQGNVVSRTATQLTVKGAFAARHDHGPGAVRTAVITIGADTKVLKTGDPMGTFTTDAISVGQGIMAFGTFADPTTSTTAASLDATAGRVRLLPTQVRGVVNSMVAGQLNLNLRAIDRLGVDMFDFAGTGTSTAVDANPADYEVGTGTLSLASVTAGESAKVLGFVTPFGAAPPDFAGRTVIDRGDIPDLLAIGWGKNGTAAPFATLGNTGIVLDLHNTSIGRHDLFVDLQHQDLLALASSPTIVSGTGSVLFGVAKRGNIDLFTSFADLVTAITTHLNAGESAVALTATGAYDTSTNTLAADHISVFFTSTN
ncbi:MAG: hypothetical protein ABI640_03080 [Gammaproteobacteria bacterium]